MDASRIGRTVGLTAGVLAGLAGVGALVALRRAFPRTSGTVPLEGLHRRVRVQRDRWGVPHIYAETTHDLFAALGYVHAQDRLWQMDLNRRTGHGQLAELLGAVALPTDRFVRVLGFGRVVRREQDLLDEHTRLVIEAYVQGINAFLETHRRRLPIEYAILRHQPRPWDVTDVLVWSKIIALNLSGNWTVELMNAHIVALVGKERARQLALRYPDDHPITVPDGIDYQPALGAGVVQTVADTAPFLNPSGDGQGSNGWVVGGTRSASGKPILANDPHLMLSLPSLWYEAHLEGGDYAVSGVTFPGMPAVIIGHNARIAWGITNAMTDVQDLYIERFDRHNHLRYQWRDGWEQASLVQEEIAVRGWLHPVQESVRITRHGPVIDPVLAPPSSPLAVDPTVGAHPPSADYEEALALRWPALEPGQTVVAALAINRAANWNEFRSALTLWNSPVQNFVYADSDGHYGYVTGGVVPIRTAGDGRLPVPGWTGAYEWDGAIPAEAMPAALDPAEGMVINANNRIAGDSYAYASSLWGEWLSGYRAARIQALLAAEPVHTIQSFARIQQDVLSLPGQELARLVASVPMQTPLEQQARDLLAAWDGTLTSESVGGTIYAKLRFYLERSVYADLEPLWKGQAGTGIFRIIPCSEYYGRRAIATILAQIATAAQDEHPAPSCCGTGRTWTELLQECMSKTVADLCAKMGTNPHTWRYGRLHRLHLLHPIGRVPLFAALFNRGPWPTGGDIDTVCMGYIPTETAVGPLYIGPSYRQICDTGNWDESCSIITGGQSGHPASRHYSDMVQSWQAGVYHPMLWSRPEVARHTVATLILEPL